ncbi:MAG: diacylglycerol/lipid kinase family protein [Armatimonadota bacterium]
MSLEDRRQIKIDHVAFVLNPSSGRGGGDRIYLAVAAELRRHGVQIAAFETTRGGGARPAVEAALRAGFTEIWTIGGDGTIQEALEPIIEAGAVLGPIPGGTSNRLVEVVGRHCDDPVAQARWMMRQPAGRMDVGRCNGRYFTVRAGIGFEAVVAGETEDDKSGLGNFAYVLATLRAARQILTWDVRLTADDNILYEGPMVAGMFANVPVRVVLRVPALEAADPVDGNLHAIIVPERPGVDALWRWLTGLGPQPAGDEVLEYGAPAFRMSVDGGAHLHIDGEAAGIPEQINAHCVPGGLRVRGLDLSTDAAAPDDEVE